MRVWHGDDGENLWRVGDLDPENSALRELSDWQELYRLNLCGVRPIYASWDTIQKRENE